VLFCLLAQSKLYVGKGRKGSMECFKRGNEGGKEGRGEGKEWEGEGEMEEER
jgi:hypothetical protein